MLNRRTKKLKCSGYSYSRWFYYWRSPNSWIPGLAVGILKTCSTGNPDADHKWQISWQTRDIDTMMAWCLASVEDAGPILSHYWVNTSWMLHVHVPGEIRADIYGRALGTSRDPSLMLAQCWSGVSSQLYQEANRVPVNRPLLIQCWAIVTYVGPALRQGCTIRIIYWDHTSPGVG